MKDRQLLELAAKACRIELLFSTIEELSPRIGGTGGNLCTWNPLQDDGDALRLAVKIGMQIQINLDAAGFSVHAILQSSINGARTFTEIDEEDRNAATRRAIVRAAAEIGKAMP